MEMSAISTTLLPSIAAPSSGAKPDDVARDFEALFWQTLVNESHLFEAGIAGSAEEGGGPIGGLLDQIFASQLAKGLDLGIGRAALGLPKVEAMK
jgi:Rod binding domain-containing protein